VQTLQAHQALYGAARNRHAIALELTPDLIRAVDLHVGLPHALDLWHQARIALRTT